MKTVCHVARKLLIPLSFIVLCLIHPLNAQAEKPRLVLLPLEGGDISQSAVNTFQSAILEELSKRYEVFSGDQVREKLKKVADKSCTSEECLEKISIAFNCSMIGRAAVKLEGDEYLLSFKIKDVFDDKIIESKSEGCKACTKSKVINKLKLMAKGADVRFSAGQAPMFAAGSAMMSGPGAGKIEKIVPKLTGDTESDIAMLIIDSNPSGAEVYLGDTKSGETPFSKSRLIAGQTIFITLKKDLYESKTLEVRLSGGMNDIEIIDLVPICGSIEIKSRPNGAEVWIAGKKKGVTPYSDNRIIKGSYLLTLKYPLYSSIEDKRIIIEAGKKFSENYTLIPSFGTLTVNSIPKGASISVNDQNGREQGRGITPDTFKLDPGSYNVRITKIGYETLDYKVDMIVDDAQVISRDQGRLRRFEGKVLVISSPLKRGASIYIDGDRIDKTVPATVTLCEGQHEIMIKAGNLRGKTKIKIHDGKTETAEVIIKKRSWFSKYKWWVATGVVVAAGGAIAAGGGGGGGSDSDSDSDSAVLDVSW